MASTPANPAARRRTGAARINDQQARLAAAAQQQQVAQEQTKELFRNRIMAHQNIKVESLSANPDNWRDHPKEQLEPLLGILSEVGWVGEIMFNNRTGHMIDGHARVLLAERNGEPSVPAIIVDLSPEEELKVLATYDFISGLAVLNDDKMRRLLAKVPEAERSEVNAILADLRDIVGSDKPIKTGDTGAKLRDNPFEGKAAATDAQHGADQSIMRNINVLIDKGSYDTVVANLNIVAKAYNVDNYSDAIIQAIAFTAANVAGRNLDATTGEIYPPKPVDAPTPPEAIEQAARQAVTLTL